jgi:hypothetical protein
VVIKKSKKEKQQNKISCEKLLEEINRKLRTTCGWIYFIFILRVWRYFLSQWVTTAHLNSSSSIFLLN